MFWFKENDFRQRILETQAENSQIRIKIKEIEHQIELLDVSLKSLRGVVNRKLYQEPQQDTNPATGSEKTEDLNSTFNMFKV